MTRNNILIEHHNGIDVLRDDKLPGGTKSVFMDQIFDRRVKEVVYASPVYGAFQIALSIAATQRRVDVTIFSAARKVMHANTLRANMEGAKIVHGPHGYLNVVQSAAKKYCAETGAEYLTFGAHEDRYIDAIADRMRGVTEHLGFEPDVIYCAVGSGTLLEGILRGTDTAKIHGVIVGKGYNNFDPRVTLHQYCRPFDWECKFPAPFQSMPNYDRKAWEYCLLHNAPHLKSRTLFWNVF
jgi:hypothetical protein